MSEVYKSLISNSINVLVWKYGHMDQEIREWGKIILTKVNGHLRAIFLFDNYSTPILP